jgi:uridine kinase
MKTQNKQLLVVKVMPDPIVIGISGISGAGKSTLTKRLSENLQATFLFWDDYDEISKGPEDYVKWFKTSKNFDDWVYNDLAETLKKLKEGQKVICPATKRELFPTDYILFDAPMGYCHRATGKYIDFLICLDTPLDVALARRLLRDYRNHPDPRKVFEELDYYLSDSRPLFIMGPEEKACDLIIDGSLPLDKQEQQVLLALQKVKHNKITS